MRELGETCQELKNTKRRLKRLQDGCKSIPSAARAAGDIIQDLENEKMLFEEEAERLVAVETKQALEDVLRRFAPGSL